MGYSHHFYYRQNYNQEKVQKVKDEVEIICKLFSDIKITCKIKLNDIEIYQNNEILFSLFFSYTGLNNLVEFYFKTNRADYDPCICMILLSCANNLNNFCFDTNGSIKEWKNPIDLYETHIGRLNLDKNIHLIDGYNYEGKIIISI